MKHAMPDFATLNLCKLLLANGYLHQRETDSCGKKKYVDTMPVGNGLNCLRFTVITRQNVPFQPGIKL